jgi:hypothetical protein
MSKSKANFVTKVLASFNKTEAQKQQESVERFLENSVIDCQEQISTRDADIKRADVAITRANTELSRAEANLETSKFSVASNFEEYIKILNVARQKVSQAKFEVSVAEKNKAVLEAERATLVEVLEVFQG